VKVDFGHKASPLTEDHMEDCNGWELASRAGLEWRLEKSVVGVYHSIHTAQRGRYAAALVMNGGEGRRDVQKRCYHLGEFVVSHLCETS